MRRIFLGHRAGLAATAAGLACLVAAVARSPSGGAGTALPWAERSALPARDASPAALRAEEPRALRSPVDSPAAEREPDGRAKKALRVDVVDSEGRPAPRVPLVCEAADGPEDEPRVLGRARTDAAGSAWIDLAGLGPGPLAGSPTAERSVRVRADVLAHDPPQLELPAQPPPAEPLVLTLPPLGAARLEVVDAAGRPVAEAARLVVRARARGGERRAGAPGLARTRWMRAPRGTARLEHVGLDLELEVVASLESGGALEGRALGPGPTPGSLEVELAVPLGPRWPSVRLRALDAAGRPLAHAPLQADLQWQEASRVRFGRGKRHLRLRAETDAEGRVRLPLRGVAAQGEVRTLTLRSIAASPGARARPAGSTLCSAALELPAGPPSDVELGDVLLAPERQPPEVLWVAGRVVDGDGTPVPAATVLVAALAPHGESPAGPSARTTAAADGSFRVSGAPHSERLVARAVAPGFLHGAPQILRPGTAGVVLALRPEARWQARLLLDPGIPAEALALEVRSPRGERRIHLSGTEIRVGGVGEGPLDVELRTREGDWLVERLTALAAGPEARGPGPEPDPWDLRGRLVLLRLRVEDQDGAPLERVFARVTPEPWPPGDVWIRDGSLVLVVPAATARIRVEPRGYQPLEAAPTDGVQQLFTRIRSDLRVDLRRGAGSGPPRRGFASGLLELAAH